MPHHKPAEDGPIPVFPKKKARRKTGQMGRFFTAFPLYPVTDEGEELQGKIIMPAKAGDMVPG